ncbi:unnamed protein product [Cochlearia groenlandica]
MCVRIGPDLEMVACRALVVVEDFGSASSRVLYADVEVGWVVHHHVVVVVRVVVWVVMWVVERFGWLGLSGLKGWSGLKWMENPG